eukprot:CAMPEP_0113325538 /NCGR_PEP_ID=MMETSP0010_2-20120614/17841_1 /TAXON_ID=216773 ORGANISM="Corethron hystrix, Strain 308" /NCGR_SAMPLE_ID=MMETSP0010_2 /ASSEMBLY_ACC=CAM_ASM_000155 /LENGTH=507 /DNA_ID=CAMNT_0000185409 /DNA_START=57 /DNA_END=1580 /DNA_ORIENTATION=+ /assembly_acc=CAM_ASM_000155
MDWSQPAHPTVVQGTVVQGKVSNDYNQMGGSHYNQQKFNVQTGDGSYPKGEQQPNTFRDVFWAFLFIVHLFIILCLTAVFGPAAVDAANSGGYKQSNDYGGSVGGYQTGFGAVITNCMLCAMSAFVISAFSLFYTINCARSVVTSGLLFQCFMSFCFMLAMIASGSFMAILGVLMFGWSVCYTWAIWHRIPFAAANLMTATTAVKANSGLFGIAYLFLIIGLLWTICWEITATGSYMVTSNCDNDGNCSAMNGFLLFVLLLSFYWTHSVIQKNTVHVTVAGTVGGWWFNPHQASSGCSRAVRGSLQRATTYSFGSICFGSLIVAVVRALRAMADMARDNEEGGTAILLCLIDCILGCIEGIVEYFNKWAYVYVGLYGYSFIESGKNVLGLFKSRGWNTIVTDNLVESALFFVNVGIGLLTGCIGFILESSFGDMYGVFGDSDKIMGFVIGFVIGFVLSSIVMSTIESATNTVIVCFAEAPAEFEANHPQLSDQMRASWLTGYPDEYS